MEKDRELTEPQELPVTGPREAFRDVSFNRATPAWFQRAAISTGLTPEQQDRLLRALGREFPVDHLLATVVENVDANMARSKGEESAEAFEYGGLVAMDVVAGIAKVLFGDMIQARDAVPPRRILRIPAGARMILDRDLDVDHVHLAPGAELHHGSHSIAKTDLHAEEGYTLVLHANPSPRIVATPNSKIADANTIVEI